MTTRVIRVDPVLYELIAKRREQLAINPNHEGRVTMNDALRSMVTTPPLGVAR